MSRHEFAIGYVMWLVGWEADCLINGFCSCCGVQFDERVTFAGLVPKKECVVAGRRLDVGLLCDGRLVGGIEVRDSHAVGVVKADLLDSLDFIWIEVLVDNLLLWGCRRWYAERLSRVLCSVCGDGVAFWLRELSLR
jgi:hypothetical protein